MLFQIEKVSSGYLLYGSVFLVVSRSMVFKLKERIGWFLKRKMWSNSIKNITRSKATIHCVRPDVLKRARFKGVSPYDDNR